MEIWGCPTTTYPDFGRVIEFTGGMAVLTIASLTSTEIEVNQHLLASRLLHQPSPNYIIHPVRQ